MTLIYKNKMPKKSTKEEFILKSRFIHGDKYKYDKSIYINTKTKLIITCSIHGDFLQRPEVHYLDKCGCPSCDPTNTLGNQKFIEKSKLIHGEKYDYSKVDYEKNNIKVEIICRDHGSYFQQPGAHLRGQGCPDCCNNKKSTTEDFIIKSNKKHHNLYDYSLVNYLTKRDKVKIICKEHGVFEQKAYVHLQGHGCPICNNSKLEIYLRNKLKNMNISFFQNFKFDDCRNVLPLPFDFYIPSRNLLIECDGVQHFVPVDYFGGENRLEYQMKNDSIKNDYCESKGIDLKRVKSYREIEDLLKVIQ
jgi:very-short-patch-repair endonuclease